VVVVVALLLLDRLPQVTALFLAGGELAEAME
jgi:hypothetical protein